MVRKFGWALVAAVSLVGTGMASAADMAVKARPVPVPVFSWTGCYIGASAGGKGVRASDHVFIPASTGAAGASPASDADLGRLEEETWLAGGQAGCNYQSGRWVFGIEGDAHAQRWSTSSILAGAVLPTSFVAGDTFELRSDWQASVRGRVGYAMDRTLFYVTGGVAFTEVRAFTNWIPIGVFPGTIANDSKTLVGGTIGAGVEHAVTNNFTLGLEGRYSWYDTERFNAGLLAVQTLRGAFTFASTYRDVRVETGEVLVKANWKFGPTAVVAKY